MYYEMSADITIKDRWWTAKKPCLDNLPIELFRHLPLKSIINIIIIMQMCINRRLEWHEKQNFHLALQSVIRAKLWQKQGISWLSLSAFLSHEFSIAELCEKEEEKQQRWVQTNTFSQLDHNRVNFNSKIKSVDQKQWGIETMVRWRFISND